MIRRSIVVVAGVLVLTVGAAVGWHLLAPRATPSGQPPLSDLSEHGLGAFREAFNAAGDEIRVIALLSPT